MVRTAIERNAVRISGAGRQPILFAHGFGCDQSMWRYLAPVYEDRFKVVLFDYVGSGRSDATAYDAERYSSLEGYARDLVEIAEAAGLHDVILVGHSGCCEGQRGRPLKHKLQRARN